ncbi:MAG: helix-turn-helix domain-containing protein [bacterium]|nr:helix-turn-helix domain-containing protein [bacterium]
MINELLKRLGFSEKEIQVYLTVLENGKIAPAQVAFLTQIKRSTVYAVAKELLKKGVITEDVAGLGGYLVALPPENLGSALKNEEQAILEKKELVKEAIAELENVPKSKSYSVPKMRFIDEYNVKDFLYRQTPVWEESMKKEKELTWWGFQDHTFVENKEFREWIEWYWGRAPKEYDLKLISNDSEIEEKMQSKNIERRIIKFGKENFNVTGTNWILGEYVVFIMSKQRPYYLVEIRDAVYAQNMREVFRNLWTELFESKA